MNNKLIGISAAFILVAGGTPQARADKIPLAQVPEKVQMAIKGQSQGEPLEHVEREVKNGQTVYEAEFKRDGLNRHVTFNSDGTILPTKSIADVLHMGSNPTVALNDLPAAVQKTIREQQAGRQIADIDRENWNGKPLYEVEFKEKGPNSRIYVNIDGSLVVDKGITEHRTYAGTQLSDTPRAVQDTVKRMAGNAPIADVDRKTRDGKVVYDVEIQKEGLNRHLQIAETGALLHDSQAGTDERVREKVTDDHLSPATLTINDVPAAVRATIRANGDPADLKPIGREIKNGTYRYHAEFEKNGKNTRLTIDENGRVIQDNR